MSKKIKAIKDNSIVERLSVCPLFTNMTSEDIYYCLECSGADCVTYEKGEMVFTEKDVPKRLPILLDGSVRIGHDSVDGNRTIVETYEDTGDIFSDVELFLGNKKYGMFAQASAGTRVVFLKKEFMTHTCDKNCGHHNKLINNLLIIFAKTAQELNQRVDILTCPTLRQKIAKALMVHCKEGTTKALDMTLEEFAEYLGVTRPSISRELMKMQDEGLVKISGRKLYIADVAALGELF